MTSHTRSSLGKRFFVTVAAAVFAAAIGAQAKSSPRTAAEFYSPSRNISCEMRDVPGDPRSEVFCQSMAHPHAVHLHLDGRLKICHGVQCLGNAGEGTPVLRYGEHLRIGRFRCQSRRAGIRCTVIRTGHGFLIDRRRVRRIGR